MGRIMKITNIKDFKPNTFYTDGETIIRTIADDSSLRFIGSRGVPHICGIAIITSYHGYKIGRKQGYAIILDDTPGGEGRWEELWN